MKANYIALPLLVLLTGCASSPDVFNPPMYLQSRYQNHDCDQISMEMDYVGQRTAEVYGQLDDEASADAAQMGIGLVLFWPALFFLEGGDGPQAAEYARLKGEDRHFPKPLFKRNARWLNCHPRQKK
ncbi:MAG: hypothetical protein U5P41_12795 [Gammaproteobacteria bacterium]|nr:hypothetical protein [Gammaproteobacteria bacterium]